jgi:hypothetical protein
MIEKVAKVEFPKNVTHKPLKLNPSKNPMFLSPIAEQAPNHEEGNVEEGATQQPQQQTGPQTVIGQTGHAWAARDEQHPRVNSPKSNSRCPDSLHGFVQDFGDSRNTSWALHCQVMVHKNSLNQEESKDSAKNTTNLRTTKTQKSSPFAHEFGRGIKGKRTTKGSSIYPPPNPQEKGLEITPRKCQKRLRKSPRRTNGNNTSKP